MAIFNYLATTRQGQKVNGSQEAATRDDVASFLHGQGLVVISIEEKIGVDWRKLGSIQIGGVPLKEKVVFAKQFATMLGAGLPLLQSLDILVQQTENPSVKDKLELVYKRVESGTPLSQAFQEAKTIFNEVQLNLLMAGEKSGKLVEVLQQIAIDLEKSKNFRGKVLGALIYPVIILFVMLIVLVLMLVFMIPSVKGLYEDIGNGAGLPQPTASLVALSELVTSPTGAFSIIMGIIVVAVLTRYYISTPGGKRSYHALLLRVPVFGNLNTMIQITQFNMLLSMLIRSGVPIVDALQIVSRALSNKLFQEAVDSAAAEVVKGNPISLPLSKSRVFPLIMVKMLATGEETGKLEQVTNDMAKFYEAEVDSIASNLTKLMEPLILLLVGGLVGFMAISIYLPLYSITEFVR